MTDVFNSVCPHDCPDTCGLLVRVRDGRVVSVKGDPDHPFTRGTVCGKAALYPKRVHSSRRITRPLRRTGPKGEGRFEPISWDEALDEIADRLKAVASEFGPESILPYSYAGAMGLVQRSSGHAFFHKLGASRLLRTICGAAKDAGFAASLGAMSSTDIESSVDADLIIIWGSNTISTNLHAWNFFMEARRRGAIIVVIDPYRNRTARKADIHVRVRPGADAALALGMMHVIINEGLADMSFIAGHTVGFDELRERVREYTPERASEICGVPADDILRLGLEYGRASAPYIRLGHGPSRQLKGGMAVRTIALLPALVGALAKPGGGITASTSVSGRVNHQPLERPDLSPPDARWINMVQLGDALTGRIDPPVKALYVYLSNPAVVAPDSGKVLAGLAREDLFLAVHELFLTETARFADIVLPGATSMEFTDFYCSYGHYYVQMARPVIQPLGECRPPLFAFQQLARRFGFTEECFTMNEEEIIRRMLPENDPYFRDVTFERLSAGRPVRLNVPENPFAAGFATPSGKVEFYSRGLAKMGKDPLPDGAPGIDSEGLDRYPLRMITPPRHQFLNSTFNEIDDLRKQAGRPTVMIHPRDAQDRGILQGDLTRVFNDRGEYLLYAEVTEDASPGVTVVEGLYWPEFTVDGKGVNYLTSQNLGDLGESCAFHCNLVEVEPASPGVRSAT